MNFIIVNASPDVTPSQTIWSFDSNTLSSEEDSRLIFSVDRRSLTIAELSHDDEGSYTLTATNPAGVHSATILLAIEGMCT